MHIPWVSKGEKMTLQMIANKQTSEFSARDRTVFNLDNLFLMGPTTLSSLSKTSCFLAFTNVKQNKTQVEITS